MRKLVFILFLFPFLVKAQVYKTGTPLAFYYDIIPDTLINTTVYTYGIESYSIDIDGDFQYDFSIRATRLNYANSSENSLEAWALNPNSFIRYGRTDSIYVSAGGYWVQTSVAKPLFWGDTINKQNAAWLSSSLSLTNHSSFTVGSTIYVKNINDWISTSDEFIGIKYENSTDTLFGWIRVNIPDPKNCLVKDFSVSKSYAGIKEYKKERLEIYPNPASNIIYLKIENPPTDSEIRLTNCLGQTVLKTEFKQQINVSEFPNGFYFLQIHSKEGVLTKKIVIQH